MLLYFSTGPPLHCPSIGYCFHKNQSQDRRTNVYSWRQCLGSCQSHWSCQTWTYMEQTNTCYLFTKRSVPMYEGWGCISGHFNC